MDLTKTIIEFIFSIKAIGIVINPDLFLFFLLVISLYYLNTLLVQWVRKKKLNLIFLLSFSIFYLPLCLYLNDSFGAIFVYLSIFTIITLVFFYVLLVSVAGIFDLVNLESFFFLDGFFKILDKIVSCRSCRKQAVLIFFGGTLFRIKAHLYYMKYYLYYFYNNQFSILFSLANNHYNLIFLPFTDPNLFLFIILFTLFHFFRTYIMQYVMEKKINKILLFSFSGVYLAISIYLTDWLWCAIGFSFIFLITTFVIIFFLAIAISKILDFFSLNTLQKAVHDILEKIKFYRRVLVYCFFAGTLFRIAVHFLSYFFPKYSYLIFLFYFVYLLYNILTKKTTPLWLIPLFISLLFGICMNGVFFTNDSNINNHSTISKSTDYVASSPVERRIVPPTFTRGEMISTYKTFFYPDHLQSRPRVTITDLMPMGMVHPDRSVSVIFSLRVNHNEVWSAGVKVNPYTRAIIDIHESHCRATNDVNLLAARGYKVIGTDNNAYGWIPIRILKLVEGRVVSQWFDYVTRKDPYNHTRLISQFYPDFSFPKRVGPSIVQPGEVFLQIDLTPKPDLDNILHRYVRARWTILTEAIDSY